MAVYQHAQAAGQPFATVILDYTVPGGMGGLETLNRLKAGSRVHGIKILRSGTDDSAEQGEQVVSRSQLCIVDAARKISGCKLRRIRAS